MQRTKKLTFFTASYSQASVIFPYVMVSPPISPAACSSAV